MSIKHKIKIRKVTGIGVHGLATGDSLDLSDNAKASDELPASEGKSTRRGVPTDDKEQELHEIDRPRFEEHTDEEYQAHLKNFFKGDES